VDGRLDSCAFGDAADEAPDDAVVAVAGAALDGVAGDQVSSRGLAAILSA
jgi:hypothetical protein